MIPGPPDLSGVPDSIGDVTLEDKDLLAERHILVVDDEQDILETLAELLSMCHVETSSTFEEAWERLGTRYYDIAILDIMGVDGYRLLHLANERDITAVMLTAHALSPDNAAIYFQALIKDYVLLTIEKRRLTKGG